ncbi:ABC transporter ATP-binding protein [candidate division SR1 bacterium]|nr:ABC transporter ATP-binding protein [candidate division SR1 bacterium]
MSDEDIENVDKRGGALKTWRGILHVLKPLKRNFIGLIAASAVMSAVDIAYPLLQGRLINDFIEAGTVSGIGWFIALYLSFILFQVVLIWISLKFCMNVELGVSKTLRNAMFDKYQRLSVGWYGDKSVGYLVAKTMSDTERLATMAAWNMFDFVCGGAYIVGIFIPIFIIAWQLGLVMLALIPLSLLAGIYLRRRLLTLNRDVRRANSKISGALNEGIAGAKTAKTLGAEPLLEREFRGLTTDMYRKSNRYNRVQALFASSLMMMGSLGVALVAAIGGSLYLSGNTSLDLGNLAVLLSYCFSIFWPITQIASELTAVAANRANAERVLSVLNEREAVTDRPDVLEKYGDVYNPKPENWERIRGEIEFVGVSFRYPNSETYILKDFNLKIPAGTKLALVGETGAGKTTIVNLICRFYEPEAGQIRIDGVDYRERSLAWLSAHLGYVLQTPHLFSGTVGDNIRYGKPDASQAEIETAACLVSCDKVIAKLEKGYDTETGECGDRLSTGQKQLITLARAVVKNPAIFILDEATSSIDTQTEHALQTAVTAVMRDRTSVVIAHRLSTIKHSDLILYIEDGAVTERGTHAELMFQKGKYYDLYRKLSELESAEQVFDLPDSAFCSGTRARHRGQNRPALLYCIV